MNSLLTLEILDTEIPRFKLFIRIFSFLFSCYIILKTDTSKNSKFPILVCMSYASSFFCFSIYQNSEYKAIFVLLFFILLTSNDLYKFKKNKNDKISASLSSLVLLSLLLLTLFFSNREYTSVFDDFFSFGYILLPIMLIYYSQDFGDSNNSFNIEFFKNSILIISIFLLLIGSSFYLIHLENFDRLFIKKQSFIGINTNDISPLLIFSFPALIYYLNKFKNLSNLIKFFIFLFFIFIPLLLLHVRGLIICFLFQLLILIFINIKTLRRKVFFIILICTISIVSLLIYFQLDIKIEFPSLFARFPIMQSALTLLKENIFSGIGINQYRAYVLVLNEINFNSSLIVSDIGRIHSHNYFLQSYLNFGFSYFLILILALILTLWKLLTITSLASQELKICLVTLVGFFAYSFLNYPNHTLTIHLLFFIELLLFLKYGFLSKFKIDLTINKNILSSIYVVILVWLLSFQWNVLKEHSNFLFLIKDIRNRNQLNDLIIDCNGSCSNYYNNLQQALKVISSIDNYAPNDPIITLEKGETAYQLYLLGEINKNVSIKSFEICTNKSINPWTCFYRLSMIENDNRHEYIKSLKKFNPAKLKLDVIEPF